MSCKHLPLLLALLIVNSLSAESETLQAGTFIPVRLVQNVNGSINNTGDKVYFQTTETILVNQKVVIAKDQWVHGKISYSKGRGMVGNGGRISIIATGVEAIDGQMVRIERDPLSSEGRTRTTNTITNTTIWGPIGLVSKGRAAGIFLDTAFELEVAQSVEIDTNPISSNNSTPLANTIQATGSFEKDTAPIRFHNGIIGKDFILKFEIPSTFAPQNLNTESISIITIYGHPLPAPVHPTSVTNKTDKSPSTATFDFWEIIQYCTPEENTIVFEITLADGTIATGATSLNRKWKLK